MKKNNRMTITAGYLMFFSVLIWSVCRWYNSVFGVKLEELLFTLTSPLEGADTSFIWDAVRECVPIISIFAVIDILFVLLDKKIASRVQNKLIEKNKTGIDIIKIVRSVFLICSIVCFILSIKYVNDSLQISKYITKRLSVTQIYDEYYINPENVVIDSDKKAKNLIYIYLESMETTYASVDDGGKQEINYMPNLTKMAKENISFSNTDLLGGFHCTAGTHWTIAALMATTSGVPFKLPVGGNNMDQHESFAPGLITLGDILRDKGYHQEFLCGSESEFAGRRKYYEQHGGYEIFDYNTAKDEGYIAEDYEVWWGLEDEILYEIAKDELLELSAKEEPFNLTLLTVDTHHVEGYVCNLCDDEYPVQTANVIKCADSQIYNFIEWCKNQEFYEDTVIIITGDHPRMDTSLVENVEFYDRTIYNCFINCDVEVSQDNLINREFTPMDMMPTTLAAMGYEIEGNRLGLGTNLFSEEQTLAEILGFDYLNDELSKYSYYYKEEFLQY